MKTLKTYPSGSSSSSSSPTFSNSSSSSSVHRGKTQRMFFMLIFLTASSLKTIDSLEDVCQRQTSPDTTAYYVCPEGLKYIFLPNVTNYKLTLSSDITCGPIGPELYCSMTTPTRCSNCSGSDHLIANLVDKKPETWWQSQTWRSLGRVPQTDITVSMGRRFILQDSIEFTFLGTRPRQAVLEKSMDNGSTWTALQYYNYSCSSSTFKSSVVNPDDVICTTEYSSEHPSSGGKLTFDLQRDRFQRYLGPNYNNYEALYTAYEATNLLEFLTFTDLRLKLLYPGTDGQETGGRSSDMLKYYYAISEISLVAGCDCNRHGKDCNLLNGEMVCNCEHNTAGNSCEKCLPLFNNRPWQKGSYLPLPSGAGNECQMCNCNKQASSCVYDPSIKTGRCQSCKNNTQGNNCETCIQGFYKNNSLLISDPSICIPCNCEPMGISDNGTCDELTGQCSCKSDVHGTRCDRCFEELWGLLTNDTARGTCKRCDCSTTWTVSNSRACDQTTGQCNCIQGVSSRDCSLCADSYFRNYGLNYEKCDPCLCDPGGSFSLVCNKTNSQCPCKANMIGARCHHANSGFHVPLPDRLSLKADNSSATTCTLRTGLFDASNPFTGRFYHSCNAGQVALFSNILDSIKRQGNVIQTYIPAIRYSLNDSNPFAHATLTFTPLGDAYNFIASLYPDVTSSTCDASYKPVTLDIFNILQGIGSAWMNTSGKVDLDARCSYKAEFKALSGGGTVTPFILDSLVLFPDPTQSLAYMVEASEANRIQFLNCLQRLATYNSHIFINQSSFNLCGNFFTSFMAEQSGEGLPCECHETGSLSPNCSALGGACECKTNVGGRRCDHCRPGFFGFSESGCQACSCSPTGSSNPVCDYSSGQCPCYPEVALLGQNSSDPLVIGDRECSRCRALHFGLSPGRGCQPCDCSAQGSLSLQCREDGSCQCKPSIGGRKCDQCLSGYFGFTLEGCKQCNCSISGSLNGTCASDGQCVCKSNVQGQLCDRCREGTFGLSSTNPDGCQPCFCSGLSSKTSLCQSADGFKQEIITSADTSLWQWAPDMVERVLAPPQFIGNKRSSYGQLLNFTYSPGVDLLTGIVQYVILESSDGNSISYTLYNQSFTSNRPVQLSIQLHESQWRSSANSNVTAIDINKILSKLSRMMIKQKFLDHTISLSLISLGSTSPTNDPKDPTVNYVENCTCTNHTSGFSCERCQQGFKRASSDSSSRCEPCDCKRLSPDDEICDEFTGKCLNCPNGSLGERCENLAQHVEEVGGSERNLTCKSGYWGLSETGCQACSCIPLGSMSQICDVTTGKCSCKPNVMGLNCGRCEDGYVNMTESGCTACDQCYQLVVMEIRNFNEMLTNQSNVYEGANSSIASNFIPRLSLAENNSTFLQHFNDDFGKNEASFKSTLSNINSTYSTLDSFIGTTLDPLRTDVLELLSDIKSNLDFSDGQLMDASQEVLAVLKGFPAMTTVSESLQKLVDSLQRTKSFIETSVFPVKYGYLVLNDTVASMENFTLHMENKINELTEMKSQVLSIDQQLNANISRIETSVNGLNTSSIEIHSQTLAIKKFGADLINRTTLVYNMVANLNVTGYPDMNTLNINLQTTIVNTAASQQLEVNNLLNQSSSTSAQVQNVTQTTSALVSKVEDFLNQVNSMTSRIVLANTTASNAVNLSIATFTNAFSMYDIMNNFDARSSALKSQASSAIQSAGNYSARSANALNLANNITASLDPVTPLSDQALSISNGSLYRCLDFGLTLSAVRERSGQLRILSEGLLNDVPMKQQSVMTIVINVNSEATVVSQSEAATQLSSRALSLRNDADQLIRNVSSVSQRIEAISSQLSSNIALSTTVLLSLLSQCQNAKVKLDALTQSNLVQTLQSLTVTNHQWIEGLVAKRQELRTQLDRLKTIVGKLTKSQ